jgi:two-component system chemotaxis response regulator CheY
MNKLILIVDDSATIIMSLKNNLEIAGYQVETATNGQEAFDKLQNGIKPNLIITDVNMPIMNGLEFLKKARTLASCKFTPILLLTTETSQERKTEAKSLGAMVS